MGEACWRLLWQLQGLDQKQTKVLRERARSSEPGLRQRILSRIEGVDRREKDLYMRLNNVKTKFRQTELDLRGLEEKLRQAEARLYSGEVINPKELAQIEHRVEEARAQRAKTEEEYLALVEETEKLEKNLNEVKIEAKKAHTALFEYDQEAERLSKAAALADQEYQQARELLVQEIPATYRAKYERIHAQHPGNALVRIEQSNCMGCHNSLAQAEIERAIREPALTTCENCGRLLMPESLTMSRG